MDVTIVDVLAAVPIANNLCDITFLPTDVGKEFALLGNAAPIRLVAISRHEVFVPRAKQVP